GKGVLGMHFAMLEELAPGSFGIPEPNADFPIAQPKDIVVMLVPGVAFDRQGNRLGYGKGYYDRYLSAQYLSTQQVPKQHFSNQNLTAHSPAIPKRPVLIGISFDKTLYGQIPSEVHDIKMDYIVTPTEIINVAEPR
ncbi:MAG: hypothetical protein FWD93_04240, partial [Coriobacteriia bacterium]|nr:hypothetical protein [Coriobacteriia bacterium]